MADTLLIMHSVLRWFVLVGVLAAGTAGVTLVMREEGCTPGFRRLITVAVGLIDLQVALGLVLWVVKEGWTQGVFKAYIHPAAMLIALALAHVTSFKAKQRSGATGARLVSSGLLGALLIIVLAIPRDAWL